MNIFREILWPVLAVIAAFVVGGIIVLLMGDNPLTTYYHMVGNSFGSLNDIGYTLFIATPLIFTGLAVAVAFRCGLLNIGAEGQLYVAAFATAWVGIKFGGAMVTIFGTEENWSWTSLPSILLIIACVATAITAGAAWGAIPGILKAKFGSHEVINTIMLNFIAVGLISYLTQNFYKAAGDPIMQTAPIAEQAHLARAATLLNPVGIGFPQRIPLNLAFLLALLMCFLVWVFLWRTKWGYEIRAVGSNPAAAEYGGINVKKQIVLAMAISGALAGMVGINEVLGYRYRYYHDFSPGYGFTGIAVALLGRNHPVGVALAAILFGALIRGGLFVDIFTDKVSKDLVQVLQAIIILFVAMELFFRGHLARFIPALAKKRTA